MFLIDTVTLSELRKRERDPSVVRQAFTDRIAAAPGTVLDYAAVVDADTFATPVRLRGPTLLALAVKFGTTRLIDNLPVDAE